MIDGAVANVLDFGAVGDGVANDTAAIQAALDAVDGCVFIPEGRYKITSALTVPARVSIAGTGRMSIIAPDSCDGFTFAAGNTNGGRSFRDFAIIGTGTSADTAITCDLDSTPPSLTRNTGMVFDNISIDGFGTGVYGRGLWKVMFSNFFMINVYNGFTFAGQSVKLTMLNCNVVCNGFSGTGNPITGITTSFGLYAGQGSYAVRPENLTVDSCYFFGFDVGIHWRSVLFGSIVATDIDFGQQEGVRVTSADGGFVLRDCWIDMNNAAYNVIGVNFVNLGTAASPAARAVLNNRIGAVNHGVNARGVYLGANHTGVDISGNAINGFGEGIRADAATNPRFTKNYITQNATPSGGNVNLINLTDMVFSENYVEVAYAGLSSCTNSYYGKNYGINSTFAIGQVSIPAATNTVTVTLASLGIDTFPSGASIIALFNNPATNNRNSVWGSCDGTNLTCNVETTFGSPAGISFQLAMT
jgi:hypothetical protein